MGIAGAAAGLAGLGGVGLKMASDFEQTAVAFKTMLGDANAAGALLKDLSAFAAETPFEFPEIAAAGKSLLAFGVASGDVKTRLREIGDVASALNIPFGELTEIYGKIKVQGRLFMEDINQLQGRGIPIVAQLAKQFGVSESAIRGMVEKGKIGAKDIELAFTQMTSAGGKFAGGMAAQSKTMAGLFSTVSDFAKSIVRDMVGISDTGEVRFGSLFDKIRTGLADAIKWIEENKGQIMEITNAIIEGIGQSFDALKSLFGEIFGAIWDVVSGVFELVGGKSSDVTAFMAGNWRDFFKVFSIVINGLALGFSQMVSAVKFAFKSLVNAAQIAVDSVIGGVLVMVAGALAPLQDIINLAINGYNLAAEAMGKSTIDFVSFADSLGAKAAAGIKASWSENGKEIADDWDSMGAEMSANTAKYAGKIDAAVASMGKTNVKISDQTQSAFAKTKTAAEGAGEGAKKAGDKAKEAADLAKKAEKERFDSLKKSMGDTFSALEAKINGSKSNISKMREEYVKLGEDLKKIDKQLEESAAKIAKLKSGGETDVATRVVKAQEELAAAKKDLSETDDFLERQALQTKIEKLNAEIALGTQYAGNAAIQTATVEAQKSEVQLVIDKTNEKIKEAETERAEIEKTKAATVASMEQKKAKMIEEATLYKTLLAERRKFDSAYFAVFDEHITGQIAKTKDAIRWMNELAAMGGVANGEKTTTTVAGARANGGPVSGGSTYLVGERGPELFTASRSGTIIPNGDAGGAITVNFGGVTISNAADADALVERVKTSLIREMRLARK